MYICTLLDRDEHRNFFDRCFLRKSRREIEYSKECERVAGQEGNLGISDEFFKEIDKPIDEGGCNRQETRAHRR